MIICLKEKLLEKYGCNPSTLQFSLMACSWCKKQSNEDYEINEDNKYLEMFGKSIFSAFKESKEALWIGFDILFLEKVQILFPTDKKCDDKISYFFEIHNDYFIKKEISIEKFNKKLHNLYSKITEYCFIEIIKRLLYATQHSLARQVILDYFSSNVSIRSNTFRTRFYFRPKKSDEAKSITFYPDGSAKYQYYSCPPFFDVGFSLDEGLTEIVTNMMEKSTNDNIDKSMYFFEIKYYEIMMSVFDDETRKKFIVEFFFKEYANLFMFKLSQYSDDKCDFYNLYNYADSQKWKEAHNLLNRIINENIDVVQLYNNDKEEIL